MQKILDGCIINLRKISLIIIVRGFSKKKKIVFLILFGNKVITNHDNYERCFIF